MVDENSSLCECLIEKMQIYRVDKGLLEVRDIKMVKMHCSRELNKKQIITSIGHHNV